MSESSAPTVLITGAFYDQFRVAAHAPLVDNRNAVDRLWKLSAALVGLDREASRVKAIH